MSSQSVRKQPEQRARPTKEISSNRLEEQQGDSLAEQRQAQDQHNRQTTPEGKAKKPAQQRNEPPTQGDQRVAPGGNYDPQRDHPEKPLSDDWGKSDKH